MSSLQLDQLSSLLFLVSPPFILLCLPSINLQQYNLIIYLVGGGAGGAAAGGAAVEEKVEEKEEEPEEEANVDMGNIFGDEDDY